MSFILSKYKGRNGEVRHLRRRWAVNKRRCYPFAKRSITLKKNNPSNEMSIQFSKVLSSKVSMLTEL